MLAFKTKNLLTSILAITLCLFAAAEPIPVTQLSPHPNVNVVILGDSNTWIGGDQCDQDKAWSKWFKDWFRPATCHSYARSGASWTNTANTITNTTEDIGILGDNNVIYNQVMRLFEAHQAGEQVTPQLIIISAGINDAWFADKRPMAFAITAQQALTRKWTNVTQESANNVLTLAESVAYCSQLLRAHFPQAAIVLVSPAHNVKVKSELINQVGEILESTGVSLNLHTIRLDLLSPIRRTTEMKRHTYTYDGIHTNIKGAKANGEIIVRSLNTLKLLF